MHGETHAFFMVRAIGLWGEAGKGEERGRSRRAARKFYFSPLYFCRFRACKQQ